MHFDETLSYLDSLIRGSERAEKMLKLERITDLLSRMGNPHHHFKSIHVGGTSGKGSTSYLIAHILSKAGYKTGLHISPHLESVTERMHIDNAAISDDECAELIQWMMPFIKDVEKENPFGKPSYFEVLVAASFEYFRRKKVDIAVVEVGLGGKLDATNVIQPIIAVITNIDLDHTEILGDSIEKIARDKSGIIKKGVDVVSAAHQPSVISIIRDVSKRQNAHFMHIERKFITIHQTTKIGTFFDLYTPFHHYRNLQLSLIGKHQVENAACAIATVELCGRYGLTVHKKDIENALSTASFPGRMEAIQENPTIILDGAHNPAKMNALVSTIKELYNQKIVSLIAFKQKKDVETMVKILAPITQAFVITQFTMTTDVGKNLACPVSIIEHAVKKITPSTPVSTYISPQEALAYIMNKTHRTDIICVTGSLYLVGEIRRFIRLSKKNIDLFERKDYKKVSICL